MIRGPSTWLLGMLTLLPTRFHQLVSYMTTESTTNVSLLQRIQRSDHDQQAWHEFVDRYGKRIFQWCQNRGLQTADAEDVTQQVLLRMSKYFRNFEYDPSLSFRGYLRRATENSILSFLKDMQRRESPEGGSQIVSWMESMEAREDLAQRLKKVFDIELFEKAMSRVRNRVNSKRWQAWYQTSVLHREAKEVAEELEFSIPSLYAARHQVGQLVREEVELLEKTPGESGTN